MRTDCFAHSCAQLRTAAHSCAQTSVRICARLCASSPTSVRIFTALICNFVLIIQFLTDLIPHRHSILCASVRIRCACAPPLYSVRNAHRHCAQPFYAVRILCACSPTSVRMRTDAHRRRCASSPLDIQFLTDDLLLCSQNAHRMRTECEQNAHRHSILCASVRIRCACAPPLYSVRNAHSHCAPTFYAVRILCAFCAHAHRRRCACAPQLAVRILCALRTDVCGSFTPYLCAAHRLRTDAHRLSTLLFKLYLEKFLILISNMFDF